jgi:hypothetical protein
MSGQMARGTVVPLRACLPCLLGGPQTLEDSVAISIHGEANVAKILEVRLVPIVYSNACQEEHQFQMHMQFPSLVWHYSLIC